jgi:hypothetical protein
MSNNHGVCDGEGEEEERTWHPFEPTILVSGFFFEGMVRFTVPTRAYSRWRDGNTTSFKPPDAAALAAAELISKLKVE